MIDAHDAVVLLEEALLLRLASPLQTLDQQAKSPATVKDACQPSAGALSEFPLPLPRCLRCRRAPASCRLH